MKYSPIAIFAYDRLPCLEQCISSLSKADLIHESDVYIYCDGPKKNASEADRERISVIQNYCEQLKIGKNTYIIKREENFGLAKSIETGVTELTQKLGKVIVLEDDLIVSPGFLTYMNTLLKTYKHDERVMHISAYMFPLKNRNKPELLFYNSSSSTGWATWDRAWQHYTNDTSYLLSKIDSHGIFKFNVGQFRSMTKQLQKNHTGELKTWAVKWHASIYLQKGLCIHPYKSLIFHIGYGDLATNTKIDFFQSNTKNNTIPYINDYHLDFDKAKRQHKSVARKMYILFFKRYFILALKKFKILS